MSLYLDAGANAAFITRPDGSVLYFDLTETERHMGKAEVTRFPVEEGGDISDNVRVDAPPFTMRVTISNTPLVPSGNQGAQQGGTIVRIPVDITPYQPPTLSLIAGAIANPVASAVNALQSLAPTSVLMPVLQFPNEFDASVDALAILQDMQNNAELLSITTSLAIYDDYVLEDWELVRDSSTGTGSQVDLTFRGILIVQTTQAAQPFVTQPNAKPPKSKGAQSLQAAPIKASVLTNITGNNQGANNVNVFTGQAQNANGSSVGQ
jgi:hypothetical protein